MNEQVRILKQKDLLPLSPLPPRVCSLEPVATKPSSSSVENVRIFTPLSWDYSNLLQRDNLGRLGGEDAAHYGR